MNYMLLIYDDKGPSPDATAEEMQAMLAAWGQYDMEIKASGVFISGEALHPVHETTTVRFNNGNGAPQVTAGPYADTKEQLSGFYLVNVADRQAAEAWATKMPEGAGWVEIREAVVF